MNLIEFCSSQFSNGLVILIITSFITAFFDITIKLIIKKHEEKHRIKYLPYLFLGLLLIILLTIYSKLLPNLNALIIILILFVLYIYITLLNFTVKVSYEHILIKYIIKRLNTKEINCFESFYNKYKKYFITTLGKYNYYLRFLMYLNQYNIMYMSVDIIDDIGKLKLSNKEKRNFYLLEFEVYDKIGALKHWEGKYHEKDLNLDEKDLLHFSSIISIKKLDLDKAESDLRKILSKSSNNDYKQLAENNLSVVALYKGNSFDNNDFIRKSISSSDLSRSNDNSIIPNYIMNLHFNDRDIESNAEFEKFIKSLPIYTIEQRLLVGNEKLLYYSQLNNFKELEKTINEIFIEYCNACESKKYPLLISLFRLTYNHNILFEKILNELEENINQILCEDFNTIMYLCRESIGVARDTKNDILREKALNIAEKGIAKIREFDFDIELSKIRYEYVNEKRKYILFKMELNGFDSYLHNYTEYYDFVIQRLNILDELIIFDEKYLYLENQLNSLFIKLDELTNAISVLSRNYALLKNTPEIQYLYNEVNIIIPKIVKIMDKMPNPKMMAQYYLQLAHHYCIIGETDLAFSQFQKFKQSKVSIENYANWLKNIFYKLEEFFILRIK